MFYFMQRERRKTKAYQTYLRRLKLSKPITNINELHKIIDKFDVAVVGSDQVWNPQFLRYSDYAYLLPFKLSNTRKVAFSVSLGVDDLDDISPKMLNMYKTCLHDFTFISLRERGHIPFLSKLINKEIYHTLDPTLLIEEDLWRSLIPSIGLLKDEEYVLVYILNSDVFVDVWPLIKYFTSEECRYKVYVASRMYPSTRGLLRFLHLLISPKYLKN